MIHWESKPIKMGCTITIPWPCGGHQEVKGVDENGNGFFKAEAIIGTECTDFYCYLQTGDWQKSLPHILIVAKMMDLGWKGIGSGEAYGEYWNQIPVEMKIAAEGLKNRLCVKYGEVCM